MSALVKFESVTEKEELREIRRDERNRLLKQVWVVLDKWPLRFNS